MRAAVFEGRTDSSERLPLSFYAAVTSLLQRGRTAAFADKIPQSEAAGKRPAEQGIL